MITTSQGLYTKEQVAVYLQISSPTLDRLVRVKKISCIKIGRSVRFRQSDLDSYSTAIQTESQGKVYNNLGLSKELAAQYGMSYGTLYSRVAKRNWSLEKALTTPIRKYENA